ncbi:unnamed protein product [Clonostachys chloroleuca]|uniref:Uncharacterized protein n=1 Tax=Clonostachys chloroleuca TaxID=1926264 RepID=A0AA35M9V7_9HYPO|nr:unnamed protein product [Clonostachys chloroleuca]
MERQAEACEWAGRQGVRQRRNGRGQRLLDEASDGGEVHAGIDGNDGNHNNHDILETLEEGGRFNLIEDGYNALVMTRKTSKLERVEPGRIMKELSKHPEWVRMITTIVKHINTPTFIIIMNSQLQLADAPEEDKINSMMTIAANAAQLMVFGPSTAPVGQSILTRPINPRWPLRHPKGANDAAFGDYSFDDLYGAIVSFLYVVHNRKGNANKLTDRPG